MSGTALQLARSAVLAGFALILATGPSAASWDDLAKQVAADVLGRNDSKEGIVTYVDDDGQRVYFSGLPESLETGVTVFFFRNPEPGPPPDTSRPADGTFLGRGIVQAVQGILAWAAVDTGLGGEVRRDDRVRLNPASMRIGVAPFFFESPAGVRRNISVSRIFRSLILYDLKIQGAHPDPAPLSADDLNEDFLPASDAAARLSQKNDLLMLGQIRQISDTKLAVRITLYQPGSKETKFSDTYELDAPEELKAEEEEPVAEVRESGAVPAEAPVPTGVLRLSLSTAPSGESGMPGRPPRTPADLFLTDPRLAAYQIVSSTPGVITLSRRPSPEPQATAGSAPSAPQVRAAPASPMTADTVILYIDTDAKMRQARFELDETDIHELSDAEFLKYTGSAAYINRIVRSQSSALHVLLFNVSAAPLSYLKYRRAIALALDRRATLEVLLNSRGSMANGFLPGGGISSSVFAKERSISSAKDLLKNVRKADRPVKLSLLAPEEDPVFSTIAERIQADLKPLAIDVKIQRVPWAVYDERLKTGQFELALASWPQSDDAREWLARHFTSNSPDNPTRHVNSALDALLSPGADLDAAQELLGMDIPAIPMFWLSKYAVLGPRVQSATFNENPFSIIEGARLAP